MAKSYGLAFFFRNRSARLLWPLLFGVIVIVPPQAWVELTTQHGYSRNYVEFLAHDYFRFKHLDGIVLPTWNHLWFVAYLWIYTAVLAVGFAAFGKLRAQRLFDHLFADWRALAVPAAYVLILEVMLFHQVEDTHDLIGDGVAHLRYFPAFLFGFGLAGSPEVLASLARLWRLSATVAVCCFLTIAALLIRWPDFSFPDGVAVLWTYRLARHLETWSAIAALVGIAERHWNHDGAWRRTLAEATFPFYVIHQTIIVIVEGSLLRLRIGPAAEFAILVPATVAGCWTFYILGRSVGWLRPFIGLRPEKHRA